MGKLRGEGSSKHTEEEPFTVVISVYEDTKASFNFGFKSETQSLYSHSEEAQATLLGLLWFA